jgi:hypothetical protein
MQTHRFQLLIVVRQRGLGREPINFVAMKLPS